MVDKAADEVLEELIKELLQMVLDEMVRLMSDINLVLILFILGAPSIPT